MVVGTASKALNLPGTHTIASLHIQGVSSSWIQDFEGHRPSFWSERYLSDKLLELEMLCSPGSACKTGHVAMDISRGGVLGHIYEDACRRGRG